MKHVATGGAVLLLAAAVGFAQDDTDKAEKAKVNAAKVQVLNLDRAVKTHFVFHGTFPEKLEDLAGKQPNGGKPFLKAEALTDPWGKKYQYDPAGPKNGGKIPDVWTVTPDKQTIGNWMLADKKKP
jgi:hypothetical protein